MTLKFICEDRDYKSWYVQKELDTSVIELDICPISNKLFHLGFKDVRCLEAQHAGTYTIHLDSINSNFVDIHYVWTPHYHLIEKKKIGRFYFIIEK